MASYTESEPVFISRCETVGLSSEAVSKLKEASINTLLRWHLYHPTPRGRLRTPSLSRFLTKPLGKRVMPEQKKASWRGGLFHEAYAVATQELKTMAERPDEAGPRHLSQPERAERYRKIKASVSGIDIKDRNEPPDALLDLCISIYEGNRLRYVSWDRCTSKSPELSSEANRDNMLTVDPQGRLKGLALEMANLLVSFAQLEAADREFFQELADRTRVGFQSSSAGIPLDSCFEEVFNLPEVTHIMQPLPKAAGGRIDPPPRRPHPYEQPAKGGARKARDQGKVLLGCPRSSWGAALAPAEEIQSASGMVRKPARSR